MVDAVPWEAVSDPSPVEELLPSDALRMAGQLSSSPGPDQN